MSAAKLPRVEGRTDAECWAVAMAHRELAGERANLYANRGIPKEDLISEGMIGLFRAAELHDPTRGIPFAAYAVIWIDERMTEAIADRPRPLRVPRTAQRLARDVRGGKVTLGDLPKIRRSVAVAALHVEGITAYTDQTRDGGRTLESATVDHRRPRQLSREDRPPLAENIVSALNSLSPLESSVIALWFGLGEDGPGADFKSIGEALSISPINAQSFYMSALRRLKAMVVKRPGTVAKGMAAA